MSDDTALIDRDLGAIESALADGAADHSDPVARELQELALALRADAAEPRVEFERELRGRVKAGFPAARGSRREFGESLRGGLRRVPRALPAFAVIASILVPLVVVVSLLGPPSPSGDDDDAGGTAQMESSGGGGGREAAPEAVVPDSGATAAPSEPPLPGGGFAPGERARRIERSVSLELETPVDEMAKLAEQVTAVTNRYGGFVLSSSVSTGDEGDSGGNFELRIPSARLRDALRDLAALAPVLSQNQSGRDITRAFVTSQDRLAAARAERRSLLRRLENAETDEQAEALRVRLDLVAREINGLRAGLRDLRLRADYAVVNVALVAAGESSSTDEDGGAGASFDDALGDAGDLLVGTAGVLIRVLALALPLGLIAAAVWLAGRALRRRSREQALA